jgi:sRNA-binding carbon storage regulator CsrA
MRITRVKTSAPIRVKIGPNITVIIERIGEKARLAVDAPQDMAIDIQAEIIDTLTLLPEGLPWPSKRTS